MSIESTYKGYLLEKYLKERLRNGEFVSAFEVIDEAEKLNSSIDFSEPIFDSATYEVVDEEEASAKKFNETFEIVQQDLNVIYQEVTLLTENALSVYERWKIEAENLEKELIDMEEEIENLLLLSQDTEGYHSILVDNFTNLLSSDMNSTTAKVNIEAGVVSLKPNSDATTQIFLNNIPEENITFRVRSSVTSRSDLAGAKLSDIFKETTFIWHTVLKAERVKPIVCELIVKLGEEPIDINRIQILTHDSGRSGTMNVTPLFSTDDLTYNQLPCTDYSRDIATQGSFYFTKIKAKYLKFILAKNAPDASSADVYRYQFGFKQIGLFSESYDSGTLGNQKFESNWLSVIDENGTTEFEKATLEVCESLPPGTKINYYLTASNLADTPTEWYPITPLNHDSDTTEILHPRIFEIGAVANHSISGMKVYSNSGTYLYNDTAGTLQQEDVGNEEIYSFLDSNTYGILDYFLYNEDNNDKKPVKINESSLVLYRGVNDWKLEEPYHHCVVEVKNANGSTVQIGDQLVSIDDSPEESGEVTIPYGVHRVRVHKQYFGTLPEFANRIIETSVDFYAARRMEKVSVFDMLNNVTSTNFDKFALDVTLPLTTEDVDQTVKTAFLVVKSDDTEELFEARFNLINELRKYIRLKAELETSDGTASPSFDGYQIKLA